MLPMPVADAQSPAPPPLVLTPDQQNAYDGFADFILHPTKQVFVVKGYAGTGKSTLVERLIDDLPKIIKTGQLINPNAKNDEWRVILTATTNKAAEALAHITGQEVRTIHSLLGLRVQKDFSTGKTKLVVRRGAEEPCDAIIFIDESSYIDKELLQFIFERTHRCKIVFIGDPAQLLQMRSPDAPVFNAGFETAELTKVMRQADDNPIIQLASAFRHTVNTGQWPQFKPDGQAIKWLPRPDFEQAILTEFSRPGWRYNDSKVLAWTNKAVVSYNRGIREHTQGEPELQQGDYAVCNHFIQDGRYSVKTDQLVQVTNIYPSTDFDVDGYTVEVDKTHTFFLPKNLTDWKARVKQARKDDQFVVIDAIERTWIDLRAAYACTINKSQGSTYDRVFIDLDDIKRCNSANQIARMMYVAVSRAREQVIFTGDLV